MESKKVFGKLPHLLTFPFKGQGALGKLAIAAGLTLAGGIIPIIPTIFLLGYLTAVMAKIVVDGEEASMPAWDDWGKFFNDGLKLLGASLIVVVPILLLFLLLFGAYFGGLIFLENSNADGIFGTYFLVLFALQMIVMFVSMLFSAFALIFQPIYVNQMVAQGEFKAIFQIKQWWQVFKASFGEFVVIYLVCIGLYMLYTYITMFMVYSVVFCCLLPFFAAFMGPYLAVVYYALTASAYRDGMDKLGLKPGTPKAPPAQPKVVEPEQEFSLPSATPEPVETVASEIAVMATTLTETVVAAPVEPIEEVEAVDETEEGLIPDPIPDPEPVETSYDAATIKMDKLQKINGIGPKTAAALNVAGIVNFAQLAETKVEDLKKILTDAGLDVVAPACGDWPQQAKDLAK